MDANSLYLDLVKRSLTGSLSERQRRAVRPNSIPKRALVQVIRAHGLEIYRSHPLESDALAEGRDWGEDALTMIGFARLDNIERCVADALECGVPGDLIEAGAWRGGATIFMRALLKARGVRDRSVWVADSFTGLPAPRHLADKGDTLHTMELFSVPVETVRANFARYGLLDDQVRFVQGYFCETLPRLRRRQWAVIRLDADLYESTMDALVNLYPGLSVGGWLIVDDYGHLAACAQAVDEFRERAGITEPLERIDWSGVCWQRAR